MSTTHQAVPLETPVVPVVPESSEPVAPAFKITTQAAPLNDSINREKVGKVLLSSIDWDAAEERTSERTGRPYKTTRSISWNMTDAEDNTYQITISVNRKPKAAAKESGKTGPEDVYKLGTDELAFVEKQMVAAEAAGDTKLHGQYMTLKITQKLAGGINKAQLIFLKNEIDRLIG